ncbi:MFS transporter [Microbacterium sp. MAHUQ-60]|uniref:MFS transporter n=1 Tax=unclassified Microbacterium TaxID=2609290 RepID=UPI00360C8E7A
MTARGRDPLFLALVYAALATAVVSSLGMLLVPVVAETMSVPTSAAQWIITGNLLVGALTAPTAGRLADGPHKKRLLLVVLSAALAGSVIAALSSDFVVLLIGRTIQGVAYGIVPIAIAIARERSPRERRAIAIATLSITVSMGLGIGYPLAGLAVGLMGLQAAFWMAAVFMVSALVVVALVVPPPESHRMTSPPFDYLGAVLLSLTLGGVVVGVSEGPVFGWTSPVTIVILAGSLASGLLWLATSGRAAVPFVSVTSIRAPRVMITHAGGFGLAATIYLAMSTSSLVAQAPVTTGYGIALPALWAGFVIMPLSLGSFVASRLLRMSMARLRLIDLLICGAVLIAAGQVLLLLLHAAIWQLLVGMLVVGTGMGVVFGVAPVIVARDVALSEVGSAVSFNQVLRTIGGTIGSAVAGSLFAATLSRGGYPSDEGIQLAFLTGTTVAVLVAAMLTIFRRASKIERG